MNIINCGLNTNFYYNISIKVDPSLSTFSRNSFLHNCLVDCYRNNSYCSIESIFPYDLGEILIQLSCLTTLCLAHWANDVTMTKVPTNRNYTLF